MKLPLVALLPFLLAAVSPMTVAASLPPRRVALVFDDGPVAQQTPALLQLLASERVLVTFSYVGRAVEAHPELARAAVEAGHDVNNHTFTHPHLRTLDDAAVGREITTASDAIRHATGRAPSWFWAPYLETDARIARLVREATGLVHFPQGNYHFISTDDWDAAATDGAKIFSRATTGVTDGTVILFHEWRAETLAQLPAILRELRRQGCVFCTFSALAAGAPVGGNP